MALQIPGYRIIRKLNQGGMSTVYLAIQISVGRIVAIKVMNPELLVNPVFSERFQREATIVGQLSHPNIVSIYDIGRKGELNYIAMDYLPGGSAHDKMLKGITGEEAVKITKEMALALAHTHEKGYVHRDIKPENILFRADTSAVLSDFGVAKGTLNNTKAAPSSSVVGTPHYMSPEQTRGDLVDARSDLYSLGVVFFEMLTGTLPYQGENAVAIAMRHKNAAIPKLPMQYQAYQSILDKFLAKKPAERFQSGAEVVSAFEQLESLGRSSFTLVGNEPVSVQSLAQALVSATIKVCAQRWEKLTRLRWNLAQGFHYLPDAESLDYFDPLRVTSNHERIQLPTNINNPAHKRRLKFFFYARLVGLVVAIWLLASIVSQTLAPQATQRLAPSLYLAMQATTALFRKPAEAPSVPIAQSKITPQIISRLAASSEVSSSSLNAIDSSSSAESSASQSSLASQSASNSSKSSIAAYALHIKVTPKQARIRLPEVSRKYQDGLMLPPGRYRLELSLAGYISKTEQIEIKDTAVYGEFTLEPEVIAPPAPSSSALPAIKGNNTPEMVRIPAGSFLMGDNNMINTSPQHKVTFAKAFAISKYEITFAQYDAYAQATGVALPGDNGWGRGQQPIIHVNWDDANRYAQWLSTTTGKHFRLPTEAEWEYVARGGSEAPYWWGSSDQGAQGKANCRRGCLSNYSGLFGSKTAPVGSFAANAFGIYDTAGNVSEWVQDCYQDNYLDAPTNGSARNEKTCQGRAVRGGSTKDNVQRLNSSARDNIPEGYLSDTLGFRLVMDL